MLCSLPAPLTEASCWAHGRRKFFELSDLAKAMRAPLAIEAVRRIDEIFAIERELGGEPAERRRIVRQARVRPLVEGLESWMRAERSKLSSGSAVVRLRGGPPCPAPDDFRVSHHLKWSLSLCPRF